MTRRPLTQEELEDAKRLKKIWNQKKEELMLSQVKVAQEMGFSSQAAVSQYLNAKLPLNMQAVAKFANVLHSKVEEISPRYARMVGNPIPSELEGYIRPTTGSIGGVKTDLCLDWFAYSSAFLKAMGTNSIKVFRVSDDRDKKNPDGIVVMVDDSPQKSIANGTYLLQQGEKIVVRKVTLQGDSIVIEDGKKMTIPKEAINLIKVLGKVVARFEKL
jgi:transcriptional regulator with XRE-family HTH domain